jgi:hypothetical protein
MSEPIKISITVRAPAFDRLVKKMYVFTRDTQEDLLFGDPETTPILEAMAYQDAITYAHFLTPDVDLIGKMLIEVARCYKQAPYLNEKFGLCLGAFAAGALIMQGGSALRSKEYLRLKEFVDLGRELAAIGEMIDDKEYYFSAKYVDGEHSGSQYVEFTVELIPEMLDLPKMITIPV